MVDSETISTTEAADILGVQPSRVRQLILSGDLQAGDGARRGSTFDKRLKRDDVLALKNKREQRKKNPKAA